MTTQSLLNLVTFAIILCFVILGFVLSHARSQEMIQKWAAQNQFTVVEARLAWFNVGPFFWRANKGQTVYRITLQDNDGRTQTGWARCGSWLWGLWSDQVTVKWDG